MFRKDSIWYCWRSCFETKKPWKWTTAGTLVHLFVFTCFTIRWNIAGSMLRRDIQYNLFCKFAKSSFFRTKTIIIKTIVAAPHAEMQTNENWTRHEENIYRFAIDEHAWKWPWSLACTARGKNSNFEEEHQCMEIETVKASSEMRRRSKRINNLPCILRSDLLDAIRGLKFALQIQWQTEWMCVHFDDKKSECDQCCVKNAQLGSTVHLDALSLATFNLNAL